MSGICEGYGFISIVQDMEVTQYNFFLDCPWTIPMNILFPDAD
jgi:hypothetical protein